MEMFLLHEIRAHLEDHEHVLATRVVLCVLLCDCQSGVATRADRGGAQENRVYYTHRSWRPTLGHTGRQPHCSLRKKKGQTLLRARTTVFTGFPVEKARRGGINNSGSASVNSFSGP